MGLRAEEAIPAEEEWDGVGDNPFGPVPSPEEVREALQRLPRPSKPVNYNTAEAEFWRLRYIPAGSVIQFKDPVAVLDAPADVGVLVTGFKYLVTRARSQTAATQRRRQAAASP